MLTDSFWLTEVLHTKSHLTENVRSRDLFIDINLGIRGALGSTTESLLSTPSFDFGWHARCSLGFHRRTAVEI
jgi:hypothetical protein